MTGCKPPTFDLNLPIASDRRFFGAPRPSYAGGCAAGQWPAPFASGRCHHRCAGHACEGGASESMRCDRCTGGRSHQILQRATRRYGSNAGMGHCACTYRRHWRRKEVVEPIRRSGGDATRQNCVQQKAQPQQCQSRKLCSKETVSLALSARPVKAWKASWVASEAQPERGFTHGVGRGAPHKQRTAALVIQMCSVAQTTARNK